MMLNTVELTTKENDHDQKFFAIQRKSDSKYWHLEVITGNSLWVSDINNANLFHYDPKDSPTIAEDIMNKIKKEYPKESFKFLPIAIDENKNN